jgi:hypothetical protein
MNDQNKWTIIYYCLDQERYGHIHKEVLKKSNPDANLLFADLSDYNLPKPYSNITSKAANDSDNKRTYEGNAFQQAAHNKYRKHVVWFQDKMIRDWLKNNFHKINTNNIAFAEWDVLISGKLPTIKIENEFICKRIFSPEGGDHWSYGKLNKWEQYKRFKEELDQASNKSKIKFKPTAIAPFSMFFCSVSFLKNLINPRFDCIFNEYNIFSELRIGTVAATCGVKFKTVEMPNNEAAGRKSVERLTNLESLKQINGFEGIYHPVKVKKNISKNDNT